MNISIYILAGGIGSRFWPKSRQKSPKQFIDILGTGKSLIQMTYERFKYDFIPENIHIITNEDYKELTEQQLPEINPDNIILEPFRRNTAPCILYSAIKQIRENPDSILIYVPSDHLIMNTGIFIKDTKDAVNFAINNKAIVTLGISPKRPDTGYGYIKYSKSTNNTFKTVHKITSFKEKPTIEIATEYLNSGEYLWNAGIFIAKASVIIDSFRTHCPILLDKFESIQINNNETELDYLKRVYLDLPNISFDYAISEKANNIYTIKSNIDWSDLGTWNSLYHVSENKDSDGNFISGQNIKLYNTKGCIIHSNNNRLLIIKGLSDYIVAENNEVTLIYPRSEEQQIKDVQNQLEIENLDKYI